MADKTKLPTGNPIGALAGIGSGAGQNITPQAPTVGRIVHVLDWSQGQNPPVIAAAIVTNLRTHGENAIDVTVFPNGGAPYSMTNLKLVDADAVIAPGEWMWPARP